VTSTKKRTTRSIGEATLDEETAMSERDDNIPEQPTNYRCGTPEVDPNRVHLADVRHGSFLASVFQSQHEGKPIYTVELRGCKAYYVIEPPHYPSAALELHAWADGMDNIRQECGSDEYLVEYRPEVLAHSPEFEEPRHLTEFTNICRETACLLSELEQGRSLSQYFRCFNHTSVTVIRHEQDQDHEISR
jgi:hypothetical protein